MTEYKSEKEAIEDNRQNTLDMFASAIEDNDIKVLEFLLNKGFKIGRKDEYHPIRHAAEKGNLAVLKWLRWHGWWSRDDYIVGLQVAEENGHMSIREWFDNNFDDKPCIK